MSLKEPRVRVLVVDDDFAVAAVHRAYLESMAEFTVVAEAHSARQALRAAEELSPDLVLLDIHLPDMSGLEVLQRLRARPGGQDLDVIAITAARRGGDRPGRDGRWGGPLPDQAVHPAGVPRAAGGIRGAATGAGAPGGKEGHRSGPEGGRPPALRAAAGRLDRGLAEGAVAAHPLDLAEVLRDTDGDVSAGEAAVRCGLSRVSSRRYLEQLTTMGLAEVRPRYGTAGRPENGYVWSGARPGEAD